MVRTGYVVAACVGIGLSCIVALASGDIEAIAPLEVLSGGWMGEGQSLGREARIEMTWESVLGGKFMKIAYRSEIRSRAGTTRVFEGHGYYWRAEGWGEHRGAWFDSEGERHPIEATFDGRVLLSTWGTESTKLGRTAYRLIDPATIVLVDSIRTANGTWKEFTRATLTQR
ncbi:MAG TPA: hypothetical protein VEY91_10490 [Candidatus Limnocylindria bacterium]|nr:hypothetical protein [Candidatus Limnocylindria bacterium]